MKIVTWNINSVRLRHDLVARMIGAWNPDIVCLQETKCPNDCFPFEVFHRLGFDHIHIAGQKGYNGVAIFSRPAFEAPMVYERATLNDARHISVAYPDFTLHNIYVPAGGDIPDPSVNRKFDHKLRFVEDITEFFALTKGPQVILGDFNIAPLEHDVWSHKQLLKVVSHTPPEVERMERWYKEGRFVDGIRHFVPHDQKCYSWWSYRNQDWKKSNRGRRLDHIWVTEELKPRLKSHEIMVEARDWNRPSDHVPVMLELKKSARSRRNA